MGASLPYAPRPRRPRTCVPDRRSEARGAAEERREHRKRPAQQGGREKTRADPIQEQRPPRKTCTISGGAQATRKPLQPRPRPWHPGGKNPTGEKRPHRPPQAPRARPPEADQRPASESRPSGNVAKNPPSTLAGPRPGRGGKNVGPQGHNGHAPSAEQPTPVTQTPAVRG